MKKQVLLFVLMLMPLMVSAQREINGIYYNLNYTQKVASVTCLYEDNEPGNADCGVHPVSSYSGEIIIPQSVYYNGVTYTVTSIESNAFYSCKGLTSVTVPNSIKSIGGSEYDPYSPSYGAFSNCTDLISINIPNSITYIGSDAFKGCSSLTSVKINDLAAWCKISFNTTSTNPLSYAKHLYLNGEEIKDLIVPDDVTSIDNYTFYNCSSLTSVTIPTSVTSIGSSAFSGCSGLTSVTIGSGIKSIGSKAFANCTEFKDMYCYAVNVPTLYSDTFQNTNYIKWGTLYVPEESVELYKKSTWSQYFGNIVGITEGNEGERCEKPVITLLANGKIKVESATEGATCVTNITASNAEPLTGGEISINTPLVVYTVTSYATKEGYNDSEVATATFRYEKSEGDMNGDGMLNIADVIHLVNMILGQ